MSTAFMAQYERDEALRRARNAAYFLGEPGQSAEAYARWRETLQVFVRNARRWNHELIRVRRRWARGVQ